jgi:UDP-N-acetylenolpyruvoylglucosamine reductase
LRERLLGVTFIGRGSNLLVRDAGISGVTVHLGSEAFTKIEVDGERLVVGAGARLKQVAMAAKRFNLTGLEFLEGIPGSVGGGLFMNAGAMGSSLFDIVERVRIMDMQGNILEKEPGELRVEYRVCKELRSHVAISAVLKARRGTPEEITSRLKEFEEKRWSSQPAAASAGCIFKNPPSISAGKVIEEVGLKGLSFGQARVSEVHGNFIVNEGGATASEVLNLISIVQERVRRERGIDLETEVIVVGDEGW